MADSIGNDIGPDGIQIPDVPQTALAFRTWRLSEGNRLLSINAPNLTGKAGGNGTTKKIGWIHRHLADPEGQDGWPIAMPLKAHCGVRGSAAEIDPDHGKIPAKECSCGIYATTSLKIINGYLGEERYMGAYIRGPVLGIVELGGRVIPATQGFRAAYARVAGILQIDEVFSLPAGRLRQIAEIYQVPLIIPPHGPEGKEPEYYREAIAQMPAVTNPSSIGDEMEAWLAQQEDDDKGGEE